MRRLSNMQRVILVLYFFAVAYCCLWVPWQLPLGGDGPRLLRLGYGWLWAGPSNFANRAAPDISAIILRLIAATALAGAAFGISAIFPKLANKNSSTQI
jgi:hypothetical protein